MQASQVELPSKRGECSSPCDGGESRSLNIVRHGYRLSVGEVLKWLKRAVLKIARSLKRREGSNPSFSARGVFAGSPLTSFFLETAVRLFRAR